MSACEIAPNVSDLTTTRVSDEIKLDEIIRSDALAELRQLRKRIPIFLQVTDEPLQVTLVLDANIVQRELRWRLRNRKNQEARSALHEAIDSETLVPFAPKFLIEEIEEHINEIAEYASVTEDRAREEWIAFRNQINFYEPESASVSTDYVDPDDTPYRQVCIELGAHAVYTRDAHFASMDVPVIMLDLDRVFRTYARASSIKLAFNIGSTVTLTISVNVLKELLKLSVDGIRKIPTPLKIAVLIVVAGALIHPKSRAKLIEASKKLWRTLNNPRLKNVLSSLVLQLAEAHETTKLASKEIAAALPKPPKRTALVHARGICAVEKNPLSIDAIAIRMRAAGYISRSQNFTSYLRRVLRRSRSFIEISPGIWSLRMVANLE